MTDSSRSRIDPRILARVAVASDQIGVVVKMAVDRRPGLSALIEIGPGLWAGRLTPVEIEQLVADEGVVFIEAAGEVAPD